MNSSSHERSILRLLKLIECDNGKIGSYAKLVDDRNARAHPNGNIFYSEPSALDHKITEILRVVNEIQTHSKSVIEHCYQNFLLESNDADDREYADATDQIREILIHQHYLSQKDIEICIGFDLARIEDRPEIDSIRTLHKVLKSEYGAGDEYGAA